MPLRMVRPMRKQFGTGRKLSRSSWNRQLLFPSRMFLTSVSQKPPNKRKSCDALEQSSLSLRLLQGARFA